jgi:ribosome modulation factor
MKITAIIADDRRPEGWPECYTADSWADTHADHRTQVERLVSKFNATLQPGELPRRVLSITSEEIDEADAFNMGMSAYHMGTERGDSYFPDTHANAPHWLSGWEQAREDDGNDSDDEEDEGDE